MPAKEMNRNGAKKGEKAPLLRPWNREGRDDLEPKNRPHRNYWHFVFGWMKFTLAPAFVFMVTSLVFMVGYHQCSHLLFALAGFFILAFISDSTYQHRQKNGKMNKGAFGYAFCAFAVLAGSLVGTSIDLTDLIDYWPYYMKRHYTNVAPDEPAGSKADASVIVFMEGSRPDGSKLVGYRRNGNTYCVAPIGVEAGYTDDNAPGNSAIQFWAVGMNCCSKRDGFFCDDAQNKKARSGLVLQPKEGEDATGEGIVSSDVRHFYEHAVQMSLSKFDLTSPDDRLYVRFVQDVGKARMGYWTQAWKSWGFYQLTLLPLWMVGGLCAVIMGAGEQGDPDTHTDDIIDGRINALHMLNRIL